MKAWRIGLVLILLAILGWGPLLAGGSAQPVDEGGMQALTSPEEATVARRLLMLSAGNHRDAIAAILAEGWPGDETEMRGHLLTISYLLYALPSLYRAEANPFTEEALAADPARVSLATPEVWEDFEAFAALAHEASDIARRAFYADSAEVLTLIADLDAACASCHKTYRAQFTYELDDLVE